MAFVHLTSLVKSDVKSFVHEMKRAERKFGFLILTVNFQTHNKIISYLE